MYGKYRYMNRFEEGEWSTYHVGRLHFCVQSASLKNWVKSETYACSGEQVSVAEDIETDAVVFLHVPEVNTLVGPFTVVDKKRVDLQPGTWTSSIDRSSSLSGNIKVEWEKVRELKNAQDKFTFLKNLNACTLSQSQIQEMLDALKEAPRLQIAQ